MNTTMARIWNFFVGSSSVSVVGLRFGIALALALLTTSGSALAAEVSLSVSGNNGPIGVSAYASFYDGGPGSVRIYRDGSTSSFVSNSGEGSASCSAVIDGATLSNGVHTLRAVATDLVGSVEATGSFTIQNPGSLSANAPSQPTEAMDVIGNAQFLARKTAGNETGTIYIYQSPSTSSNWTLVNKATYTTPEVSFSCENMINGLFDVATWHNGDYDINVKAFGVNDESLELDEPLNITIQNPINIFAEVDPNPTGPVNVTGTATFMARKTAGDETGTIYIYQRPSGSSNWAYINTATYTTPEVSFSCENMINGLFDVATWHNGDYDINVKAFGVNYDSLELDEPLNITIQNPINIFAEVDPNPTGPVNVTGTATFMARKTAGDETGTIYIYQRPSGASNWAYINTATYTTPEVSFSCENMINGLFDVATWHNGDYDINVKAFGVNYDSLELDEPLNITIQNPINIFAEVDPNPTGPVNVTGTATFMARKTAGDETGTIYIYQRPSGSSNWAYINKATYTTPEISFSCENMINGLFDVATWRNGDYDINVKAFGVNHDSLELNEPLTTTIQNPVSVSAQSDPNPSGPLNITGNAVFMARKTDGDTTGTIDIDRKPPGSSSYYSYSDWVQSYTTPNVDFSCEDMTGGLYDVATWDNGEWTFRVKAIGVNGDSLYAYTTSTIQNPIDVDSQVDSNPTGPLNVTGTANFIARLSEGDTTGRIEIIYRPSTSSSWSSATDYNKSYTTPQVNFSCEEMEGGPFDVATWANGDYQIRVRAIGANSEIRTKTRTTTIDNTPKVTASCPPYVSGDFDITGAAVFTENRDVGEGKGTLYINIDSRSTTYAETKSYDKGDPPNFSYAEITGALLNAESLGYGEHVAYIRAKARNGTWSEWLEVPFTTGEPAEDGSGNTIIVPQQ